MALTIFGRLALPPRSGHRTAPAPPPAPPGLFPGADKRYGNPLPLVAGRALVDGQAVYQGGPGSGSGYVWNGTTWQAIANLLNTNAVIALCEAPVTAITRSYKRGGGGLVAIAVADFATRLTTGGTVDAITAATATAWSAYVGTAFEGLAHSGTCHVRITKCALQEDGKLPETKWEVEGTVGVTSVSTPDAEPAELLLYLLTNPINGLGYPTSMVDVDNGADGLAASGYRRYTRARGWYVSRAIEQGDSIAGIIEELLLATNSTIITVDGKLKAIPLDDEASFTDSAWPGHATYPYTPVTTIVAALTKYVVDGDEDPVQVERSPRSAVASIYPVDYTLRKDDGGNITYATNHAEWQSDVWTSANGLKRAEPLDLTRWILKESHAFWVTYAASQRAIHHRMTYRFRLGRRHVMLAPGDFISITESGLGLSARQARVEVAEEDERGRIEVLALEWPLGTTSEFTMPTTSPAALSPSRTVRALASYDQADSAQTTADSKIKTFYQAAAPTATTVGDIWFDTDDGYKAYRWDGSAWQSVQDTSIATAQATADGKNKFSAGASPHSPAAFNDVWFNGDTTTNCPDNNCLGHTLDGNGVPNVGAYPHRKLFWVHRCSVAGSPGTWLDAKGQEQLIAADIMAGHITAVKLAAGSVVTDKIILNGVTLDKFSLGLLQSGNLWPNPNSENAPPSGADTTTAEFKNRYNAGAGAYSGAWVRRVSTALGNIGHRVPASYGDGFYFFARAKQGAGADSQATLSIYWYDSTDANISISALSLNTTSTWQGVSMAVYGPAGTAYAICYLTAGSLTADDEVWFDTVELRLVLPTGALGLPVEGNSSSSGSYSTLLTTTYQDVTNLSVTFTSSAGGRPVLIFLDGDGANKPLIGNASGSSVGQLRILQGATTVYECDLAVSTSYLPGVFETRAAQAASTSYTYKLQVKGNGSGHEVTVVNCRLRVVEL